MDQIIKNLLLRVSLLFFLFSAEGFGQISCIHYYIPIEFKQNADPFINWEPIKTALINSGIAKSTELIQADLIGPPKDLTKVSSKKDISEELDYNSGPNPTEMALKVSYKDKNGKSQKKYFLAKTQNHIGPKSNWDFFVAGMKEITPEDAYLDLTLGWRNNDAFRMLSSIRFEMEEAKRQLQTIHSKTKDKAESDLIILYFQLKDFDVDNVNGNLSSDIITFISKWNQFKRLNFQKENSVDLSIALVERGFKSQNFKDKLGNDVGSATSENLKVWLGSNSNFLKFDIPLIGQGTFEKVENLVNFNFNGKIPQHIRLRSIEEKLKASGLLEFSTIDLRSTQDQSVSSISLKVSNISLSRPHETEKLTDLFERLESFLTGGEINRIHSINIERAKIVEYMIKKSRKVPNRIDTLEKKAAFIAKAYEDYYRNKAKNIDFSNWLHTKMKIGGEAEVIQYLLQVFPNMPESDKQILKERQQKLFNDFINSIKL